MPDTLANKGNQEIISSTIEQEHWYHAFTCSQQKPIKKRNKTIKQLNPIGKTTERDRERSRCSTMEYSGTPTTREKTL